MDHGLITDGVSAMHISIANSIEDDRSSVEILSPTFSNHYKQAGIYDIPFCIFTCIIGNLFQRDMYDLMQWCISWLV